ncbi:MAG: RES domain-containing protein [Candidatus Binatia bacterium]
MLYRAFPLVVGAGATEPGGALYVAREAQGSGRHDNPERYGALYVSASAESAVAERIQAFRGQALTAAALRRPEGGRYALAAIDDSELPPIIDLDDPRELVRRKLRPSEVATRRRSVTQAIALRVFQERRTNAGLSWWSALEASWTNVTLFEERAARRLRVMEPVEILSLDHPALRAAGEVLGIAVSDERRERS